MKRFGNMPWLRGVVILGVLASLAAGLLVSNAGAVAESKEVSKKKLNKAINGLEGDLEGQIVTKLGDDITRHSSDSETNSTSPKFHTVTCPAGKLATGGGGITTGTGFIGLPPNEVALQASYPGADVNSWTVVAAETTAIGTDWGLAAYVLCATPG